MGKKYTCINISIKQLLGLGLRALLGEDFRKEDGGADHHIGIVFRLTCTLVISDFDAQMSGITNRFPKY
jgi:hypothetical protein